MSGPKIVRVVPSIAYKIKKQNCINLLENKVEELKSYATEHCLPIDQLEESMQEFVDHFYTTLEEKKILIEGDLILQIEFWDSELKKMKSNVKQLRLSKWEELTKLKSTHNELRNILSKHNIEFEDFDLPADLDHLDDYRKKVDQLYEQYIDAMDSSKELTEEQKSIQERLLSGDSFLSVKEWRAKNPRMISRLTKLEGILKEMYISEISQPKIQEYLKRIGELDEQAFDYDMKLDSITLEAADFTRKQQVLAEAKNNLQLAIQLLQSLDFEIKFLDQWNEILQSEDLDLINETTAKAEQLYKTTTEDLIVDEKRKAILKALDQVGYEINEQMETAWVENGRLVVKKSKQSLYGVEFMSPKNMSRIQTRLVADQTRSNERSPSLDKQEEEKWCEEFEEITKILKDEELSVFIDRAEEAGAIKLKEVELDDAHKSGASTEKKPSRNSNQQ